MIFERIILDMMFYLTEKCTNFYNFIVFYYNTNGQFETLPIVPLLKHLIFVHSTFLTSQLHVLPENNDKQIIYMFIVVVILII